MGVWSNLRFLMGGKNAPEELRYGMDQFAAEHFTYGGLAYPFGGGGYGGSYGKYELAQTDFPGYVSQLYKSDGIVYACMAARASIFTEARFQYQRQEGGRPTDLWGDSTLDVLNDNPGALLARAIQDADLSGNHYLVKEGNGSIVRRRPDWMEIILTEDPKIAVESEIAAYMYQAGGIGSGGEIRFYLPENVAHWVPPGQNDPIRQYMGMSWLTPIMREILSDKGFTLHKSKFIDNAATPNLAVSLKDTVTQDQFKEFMELMNNSHRGVNNAYETLYLGGGADVTVIGADMRTLDFKTVQGAGETRIAAAARVHPVIVGLSEGMAGSSLNAGNFKAAKDSFGDGTMRPLWRSFCAEVQKLVKPPPGNRLWYDDRDIQFLRADLNERAEVAQRDASIIRQLTDGGWKPDSIKAALKAGYDWDKLVHSGLVSVQLLPPGTTGAPTPDGNPSSTPTNGGTQPGRKPGGKSPAGPPVSGGNPASSPKPSA